LESQITGAGKTKSLITEEPTSAEVTDARGKRTLVSLNITLF
jgi:hypothetical protein